ncbi:MAG: SUMF1/EgtB/PvdO family nonheme iron enzyme [Anaerolineales bacterium]
MARIEKTVFISYRRKDISWALAVYQYLTSQKYDVFFDYTSLSGGDFEQVIISNIKARAHFILILTPTTLDRCDEPGDWVRREIETAVDEKRNIIPIFFDGFSFGLPSVAQRLTGKLSAINRYNGLDVPAGYFLEAMEKLRNRYLNIPLNAVIHPVPTEVRKVVKEEQDAANVALVEKNEDIQELVKPVDERSVEWKEKTKTKVPPNLRPYGIGASILLSVILGVFGINSLIQNTVGKATATLTLSPQVNSTSTVAATSTFEPMKVTLPDTATAVLPTAVPTLGIGSTMVSPQDGMTLIYVPAGEFTMGSNNGQADEMPTHKVYLDAFWIDQTEVTNKMYSACVDAGVCNAPTNTVSAKNVNYYGNIAFDNYPVIYVTWNMASTYCGWAERRLPTEAEWEKAARGSDGNMYPWGNNAPDGNLLNFNNIVADTSSVKSYETGKSPYGAYDMSGNVWEWVNDWYSETYYSISEPSNPRGPDSGQARVQRGGSFYDTSNFIYSSKRDKGDPGFVSFNLGFRCAISASK